MRTPTKRYCPRCFEAFTGGEEKCPEHKVQVIKLQSETGSLQGRMIDGKYEILEILGKGGMGTVYRARQMPIGREVALKVLHKVFLEDHKGVSRFVREAQAASMLKSRYSAMLHDFGLAQDGFLYYTMELATGRLLSDIIDRDGALGIERSIHIAADICHSLAEAHANGIVHRDLKPDNIMITHEADGHEIGKVLDFGTAKLINEDKKSSRITDPGIVSGTPEYMSPEQAKALDVDGRSDVYSLGVLMYEMLTGAVPFRGTSNVAVLVKHVSDEPERLSLANPSAQIPDYLERLVLGMLAKDPDDRPATIIDVLHELQQALEAYVDITGNPQAFNVRQHESFRIDERIRAQSRPHSSRATAIDIQESQDIPTALRGTSQGSGRGESQATMQFQADQMWQDAGHEVIENERQPTVPELPMVDVAAVTPDVDSARGKPRWRLATWTFSGGVATLAIVLLLMFQSPQDVTIIGGRATGDIADSPAVPIDRQPAKEDVRQNRASKQPEEAFRPEHPSVEKSAPVQHRKVSTTDPETTRVEPKKVTRKELMLQELPKEMGEAENVLKADDSNLADLTFSSPPAVPEPASVQAGLEPEKSVKKEPEPDLQSSPEVKSPEVVKRGGSKVEGSKRNRTESRRTEGQKKQYSTARKVTTKEPLTETKRSEIAVRKKVSPIEVKVRDEDGKVSFTVDDLQ